MSNIEFAENRLYEMCHSLAKALRWQRKPFDTKEISELADYFYRNAILFLPYKDGNRLAAINCMCGAVDVLNASICGPNNDNPEEWFSVSIQILMAIVEPTSVVDTENGLAFLADLENGIKLLRTGEDT